MIATIDEIRKEATLQLDQDKRSSLGQYLTPVLVAKFMASLFAKPGKGKIHLLDAGCGVGSLTVAFLDLLEKHKALRDVEVTAYDLDQMLLKYMAKNVDHYRQAFKDKGKNVDLNLRHKDFIEEGSGMIEQNQQEYTHAILNPPYKKINSDSEHRKWLRTAGVETVNLYSGFIALAVLLLKGKGELVAIIPRSFCNGNYYKPFRKLIIEQTAIKQLHLFDSRRDAFKDDDVLQENIIIHLVKGAKQSDVVVSRSKNEKLDDFSSVSCDFNRIVKPDDEEYYIHVPQETENHLENSAEITYTLADLGISVSTGPVVDFRALDHISHEAVEGSIPLIYPMHFDKRDIGWPKSGKKPNAIANNEHTIKSLFPNGFYTVVKRFSSKEEKQRIIARVVNPSVFDTEYIGLENHVNVFHYKKKPIDQDLAYGLAAYLNSSAVDTHFRNFSGHTQVNATDLKQMRYPSRRVLIGLGKWAKKQETFNQDDINLQIQKIL